jgi:hopanoid C-3 methylase
MPRHDRWSYKPAAFTFTSQGCPFRCSFCSIWPANLGLYRRRPVAEIVEELKSMDDELVFLFDDNTLAIPEFAEELADAIKAAGIRKEYSAYSRADHIVEHPELVRKWADVGMKYVVVGVESVGSDQALDAIHKETTLEQNVEALRILREAGIYCYAHILLTPEMTRKDFDEVYDFIADNGLEYPITPYLTPLPGTELFEEMKAAGRLLTEDPEVYTYLYMVVQPEHMSLRRYDREVDRFYRRVWSWKRYLSGRAGDTNFVGFIQWWIFVRLMIVYLVPSRSRLYRQVARREREGLMQGARSDVAAQRD